VANATSNTTALLAATGILAAIAGRLGNRHAAPFAAYRTPPPPTSPARYAPYLHLSLSSGDAFLTMALRGHLSPRPRASSSLSGTQRRVKRGERAKLPGNRQMSYLSANGGTTACCRDAARGLAMDEPHILYFRHLQARATRRKRENDTTRMAWRRGRCNGQNAADAGNKVARDGGPAAERKNATGWNELRLFSTCACAPPCYAPATIPRSTAPFLL